MPHEPSPDFSSSVEADHKTSALRNSPQRWGLMSVSLHWVVALAIIGLFILGQWMTSLSYYDPWYKQGPALHKAIGVIVFAVFAVRLAWRLFDPAPSPVPTHKPWEHKAAHVAHWFLYAIVFGVLISGYLISTADGRAVSVFGLFEVPATITSIEKQEDAAGAVHDLLAGIMITVAGLHALVALKHHIIDKDNTLKRMFGRG